jgi:hypothetical protein
VAELRSSNENWWLTGDRSTVTGAGHADIEFDCNNDGTVCSQIGEAEVPIAALRTWVVPVTLPTF